MGFAFLGFRLFDLQVNRHEEFRGLAETNTVRTLRLEPMRGQIQDIHGTLLAISMPVKVVCANPSLVGPYRAQVAQTLAPLLDMTNAAGWDSYTNLLARLAPKVRNGKTNVYVVLKRKVPLENWARVHTAMTNLNFGAEETKLKKKGKNPFDDLRLAGVFTEEDQIRVYPNKFLASHVLGYVGVPAKQTNAPAPPSLPDGWKLTNAPLTGRSAVLAKLDKIDREKGLNGIEFVFDSKLAGTPGWRQTEKDGHGNEILKFREQDVAPCNGLNVVLTLDAGIQHIVEEELSVAMSNLHPVSISCMVIRPRTGEIVAMATLPSYDPNEPGKYDSNALRNRVICDVAEPGSTFKIIPISAALTEKICTIDEEIFCENGHFFYGGKTLHEAHGGFGNLSVADIIVKSSNIGAAKIGIRLWKDRLYSYCRQFGIGSKTGIPLPGEVSGILHPVRAWDGVSIARIPMGQGVAVTPLQMAMAMSAIANDGVLMKPMLVKRLVDEGGNLVADYQPQVVGRVISEQAAKDMVGALKGVPTAKGTAEAAALEHYTVAGKTGTAQENSNGAYNGKYFSSFIGFFPADNPELCISVVLDDPPKDTHFGGKAAAPVYHNIAERSASYLNIKPDRDPDADPAVSISALGTVVGPVGAPARKPASGKAAR